MDLRLSDDQVKVLSDQIHPSIPVKALKGTYSAKFTFTCCLNINVCWQCVHNHPIMIKIHSLLFVIPINYKQCLIARVCRICKMWRPILHAPSTTVDGHWNISRDPTLSEPHTIRHVYLHARTFKSNIQIKNVFLLKLQKLFSQEQWAIFCFYFIGWVILTA